MRYLIVRTDVRTVAPDEVVSAWAHGQLIRDERTAPEPRRQTMFAEDRDAALHLARALASVGPVRAGRQRIKILRLGEPLHRHGLIP
ncbi:MAG TPA: hypothetical protein VFE14_18210 [Micromonosporaceae bacterium]|jgi:hypothetical protein|nr:hypothetical protein [Micromonosporaceae bacterium]